MREMAARGAMLMAAAALIRAQGTTPKASVNDYAAHAMLENGVSIGAEYLVRSVPTTKGALITSDYLVIEAMFFGPLKPQVKLSAGNFALRINGQKDTITPESTGTVSASVKYPDWTQKPSVSVEAGDGEHSVMIGPRTPVGRFPDDPSVRTPPPSPVPPQDNPTGIEKDPPMSIDEMVERAAMPEQLRTLPAGGLLYFYFPKNTKKIKSLELIYQGPEGKALLKLF